MSAKLWLVVGSLYGFLGVALGAFGAHGLRARLTPDMLAIWKTGVEYQLYHALALLLVGVLARQSPATGTWHAAGACFAFGVLVFSGSLYALTLSGVRVLGAITPVGGLFLLAGWICLALAALRSS